jgi:transposase-like protein
MKPYPLTLPELKARFASEEACRNYLEELRWPLGPLCPRCEKTCVWRMSPPYWRCADCHRDFTVTVGTLLEGTHKPLAWWLDAIWHVVSQKNGVSALGLQRELGFGSYHTAWNWLHKLRRAMVRPGRDRLAGSVEFDEVYIGGEASGKRGRGAERKSLIIIAAQALGSGMGRIRLQRVADASSASLCEAIEKSVAPGSTVLTDGWKAYAAMTQRGYVHGVVRREAIVGDNLLPRCNRVAALLKRWLLGTHQGAVLPSHLDYYLDEFTFRFNRRTSNSRGLLFYRLVGQTLQTAPIHGEDLRAKDAHHNL